LLTAVYAKFAQSTLSYFYKPKTMNTPSTSEERKYGLRLNDLQRIIEVLTRYEAVESAILYGSRARGNFKPASDIDLTLKGANLNQTILNKIDWDLDDLLLPVFFDLSIYHRINNENLKKHIDEDCIEIYLKP